MKEEHDLSPLNSLPSVDQPVHLRRQMSHPNLAQKPHQDALRAKRREQRDEMKKLQESWLHEQLAGTSTAPIAKSEPGNRESVTRRSGKGVRSPRTSEALNSGDGASGDRRGETVEKMMGQGEHTSFREFLGARLAELQDAIQRQHELQVRSAIDFGHDLGLPNIHHHRRVRASTDTLPRMSTASVERIPTDAAASIRKQLEKRRDSRIAFVKKRESTISLQNGGGDSFVGLKQPDSPPPKHAFSMPMKPSQQAPPPVMPEEPTAVVPVALSSSAERMSMSQVFKLASLEEDIGPSRVSTMRLSELEDVDEISIKKPEVSGQHSPPPLSPLAVSENGDMEDVSAQVQAEQQQAKDDTSTSMREESPTSLEGPIMQLEGEEKRHKSTTSEQWHNNERQTITSTVTTISFVPSMQQQISVPSPIQIKSSLKGSGSNSLKLFGPGGSENGHADERATLAIPTICNVKGKVPVRFSNSTAGESVELDGEERTTRFFHSECRNSCYSDSEVQFNLWPVWNKRVFNSPTHLHKSQFQASRDMSDWQGPADSGTWYDDDSDSSEDEGRETPYFGLAKSEKVIQKKTRQIQTCCSCKRPSTIVMNPSGPFRICWDMFSAFFVTYECVFIPLQFFDLQRSTFAVRWSWAVRIFWTVDLFLSFITGYHTENTIEMRLSKVVPKYVRTWFLLDLAMLIIDWLEVFISEVGGLTAARMGKTVKSIRMIRVVRVVRLLRLEQLPDIIKSVEHYFRSELCGILLGLVKMVIAIVWIVHVVACGWYGIATVDSDKNGWIDIYLEGRSIGYSYMTSFHWGLTQFAGSMDVQPQNISERIYAVAILLCAFLVSAWVVSSITSSMTRLEIATARSSEQLTSLKQYLFDHKISRKLALRVQRNATRAMQEQSKNRPESSIDVLGLVSDNLRRELHFEIFMPSLNIHPFFRDYAQVFPSVLKQACHTCVSHMSLVRGDMLFGEGEIAHIPQMYFIVSGRLAYTQQINYETIAVVSPAWACEAVVWTPWVHCGSMRVKGDSNLLLLDAQEFQEVATRSEHQGIPASNYAACFVRCLNELGEEKLTDINTDVLDVEEIATQAMPQARRGEAGFGFARRGNNSKSGGLVRSVAKNFSSLDVGEIMKGEGLFRRIVSMVRGAFKPPPRLGREHRNAVRGFKG